MADINSMSRQRLDFRTGPNGKEIAILTVTLGDKSVHRFEESADDAEVDRFAKGIANAEMQRKQIAGEIAGWSEEEISGWWSKIKKGVKKIGKVARKIATSKVFRKAAQGLVAVAPALGPFGGAAAAIGGGMMVASKLANASIAAESGARGVSRLMSGGARKYARRITRGRRGPFSQIMRWGNRKRKGAMAYAGGRRLRRRSRSRRRPSRPRWAPQRPTRFPQWQQYARAGRQYARQAVPRWAY